MAKAIQVDECGPLTITNPRTPLGATTRRTGLPKPRYDRWSLRYKGYEFAQIESLGFFKITGHGRESVAVELWPLNDHARRIASEFQYAKENADRAV